MESVISCAGSERMTEEMINVQQGAEEYASMFKKPDDPWDDPVTWARVKVAPKFIVPDSAIAGLNQAAIFQMMGLITEGVPATDAYIWYGIKEMLGFMLTHAHGKFAWLMVLEQSVFDEAVLSGAVTYSED